MKDIIVDTALMKSVARQMMEGNQVKLPGQTIRVKRTCGKHLRTASFQMDGREYQAIEQNRRNRVDGGSLRVKATVWSSSKMLPATDSWR